MPRIVIIGAGASGLICAIELCKANIEAEIYLIDKNKIVGKKINATGNGRCNLSNLNINKSAYHGDVASFFSIAKNYDAVSYFSSLGLLCRNLDDLVYPYSLQAKTVSKVLELHLSSSIHLCLSNEVTSLKKEGKQYKVTLRPHEPIMADYVVLATGGLAGIQNTTAGYSLLKDIAVEYAPLYPSLLQLKVYKPVPSLKGVRVKCKACLYQWEELIREEIGEVLFSEKGLSGISIFQLSSEINHTNFKGYQVHLDLFPNITIHELVKILKRQKKIVACSNLKTILLGMLPLEVCKHIATLIPFSSFDYTNSERIASALKKVVFDVEGVLDFNKAQVTKGGIKGNALHTDLSLKKHSNVFACGEILNIDGDCGGYNLHFAFSSGYQVAHSIIKRIS